jgi:hypothetical protein
MLLSMLVSFLLALKLRQEKYVLFSAIMVALVSFLSAGVPHYESYVYSYLPEPSNVSGVVMSEPLPLSFPFYAYINRTSYPSSLPPKEDIYESYQVELLTFKLPQSSARTIIDVSQNIGAEQPTRFLYLDWGDYLLYYTFFFALNLVGTIIGYWVSRTAFIDQWLRKRSH